MTLAFPSLYAELFSLDLNQLKDIDMNGYSGSIYFSPKAEAIFQGEYQRNLHLLGLLELEGTSSIITGSGLDSKIITLSKPRSDCYFPFGIKDSDMAIYVDANPTTLVNPLTNYYSLIRKLIIDDIRSKSAPPLQFDKYTVFDSSFDIASQINKDIVPGILQPLQANPGFSFQLRNFGNDPYIQILPQSVLRYSSSIWDLVNTGWNDDKIIKQFPYVNILNYGRRRLVGISMITLNEPLREFPYNSRSFKEYAKLMFPNRPIDNLEVRLVQVVSESDQLEYFPSDWVYPSLTFKSISMINERYYSELTGLLKAQSKARIGRSVDWAARFTSLNVASKVVRINPFPKKISYDPRPQDITRINSIASLENGFIFAPPPIEMLRNGIATEIVQGVQKYQGTINDLLMHSELKPLDSPKAVRVIVFIETALLASWNKLRDALIIPSPIFRGFKEIFGVDLILEEESVDDLFSEQFKNRIKNIPERGYDCALIVTHRYFPTQEETKRVYDDVKTMIMERGVPVQFVTDDQKITFNRDNSLMAKSKNAKTLFGLGINILAKVGTILAAIGGTAAGSFINNSATMGYNVARVFPKNYNATKSVPLAAPLVIFDNKGSYISHQNVYKLTGETSLFKQHGDTIFSALPKNVSTLIVHKDGYFYTEEIDELKKRAKQFNIEIIPISIRTGSVPRVSDPKFLASEIGLKAGTCLPLSENDFLMMTTPFQKWNPEQLGWPKPILISFHGAYDLKVKLQLLYHIFALTKMQTGSQRATRLPVSIHYANMIASFLRRIGDPNPKYLKYFISTSSDSRFLPRWFV